MNISRDLIRVCPLLLITHQLPKGLQVDDAVLLGKNSQKIVEQEDTHSKVNYEG